MVSAAGVLRPKRTVDMRARIIDDVVMIEITPFIFTLMTIFVLMGEPDIQTIIKAGLWHYVAQVTLHMGVFS